MDSNLRRVWILSFLSCNSVNPSTSPVSQGRIVNQGPIIFPIMNLQRITTLVVLLVSAVVVSAHDVKLEGLEPRGFRVLKSAKAAGSAKATKAPGATKAPDATKAPKSTSAPGSTKAPKSRRLL